MADFIDVDVAYVAPVTYIPQRARNPRTVKVAGTVPVRVPCIGAADAPLVVRGSLMGNLFERRLFDGRLVGPLGRHNNEGDPPGTWRTGRRPDGTDEQRLRALMADPDESGWLLFGHGPAPWKRGERAEPGVPLTAGRIPDDGRGRVEAQVRAAAAGLVLIDGRACQAKPEPVLSLLAYADGSTFPIVLWGDEPRNYAFRLDRREACEAFMERNIQRGLMVLNENKPVDWGVVEHLDPGGLRFREDVNNARHAAGKVLEAAGQHLANTPWRFVAKLGELALARDALEGGGSLPQDVHDLLGEVGDLAGDLGRRGRPLMDAIALGRAAIAASQPSPEVAPLAEADTDAFQGMALMPR